MLSSDENGSSCEPGRDKLEALERVGGARRVWVCGRRLRVCCPGHSGSPSSPMSHALLLRLFLSPSFFSVHVALQYLRIYADNIGITYYLTRRLRELDTQELREVWGFVW